MEHNLWHFYQHLKNTGGIINVEYEPEVFQFPSSYNSRSDIKWYIPDFKITTDKGVFYIEAKGVVDDRALKKARLLSENYPRLKLFFITPRGYKLIYKYYSHLIKDWK